MATAILRAVYLAIGSFAFAFLPAWAATDELKAPLISGGMAALAALGFRAGIEGLSDRARDQANKVVPGDVGGSLR